jgi:hypothetical protein
MGKIIATLASEITFTADAPNYLQKVWNKFCTDQPNDFALALGSLKVLKKQRKSLEYLNESFHETNRKDFTACIKALERNKKESWAKEAKKFLRLYKKHRYK